MGKSGSACFDIVSCGRVSGDQEDFEKSESGQLLKKRRWSFRKRSSNRLLTTTVISVPLPLKEAEDQPIKTSELTENSLIFENFPSPKNKEDLPPPSETYTDTHEFAAAKIQGSIRRYLSYKEAHKLKSLIKIQALVRGYLVRRQAAGTLRCVHAIVKMQGLVRARLLKQSLATLPNQNGFVVKEKKSCSSEKMLKSPYVRQLLESTRKSKPIHISCDHSKSDSAWKWLERWMTLSAPVDADVADDAAPEDEPEKEKNDVKIPEKSLKDGEKHNSFAAVQAKFEELCSLNPPSLINGPIKPCQVAPSDCGTEISVSSTLDSPDRSEAEITGEIVMEIETLERRNAAEQEFLALEELPRTEDLVNIDQLSVNSKTSKQRRNPLTMKKDPLIPGVTNNGNTAESGTPEREGSLPSFIQATESATEQDFLSLEDSSKTEDSVNSKNSKQKRNLLTKIAELSPEQDSLSVENSSKTEDSVNVEQLSVNSKNSKRRRNLLTKNKDPLIPGITNNGNSTESGTLVRESLLPSYMQATESARAKVNALTSPKSSPDVSREVHGKRRLSAPLGNGKFDSSPRVPHSSERRWLR